MQQPTPLFQQRDRKRWLTDRFASLLIKLGGMTVLIALVLLIVYLLMVIFPIFTSASLSKKGEYSLTSPILKNKTLALGVNDVGNEIYQFTQNGDLVFSRLSHSQTEVIHHQQVIENPVAFKAGEQRTRWYAYSDNKGRIYAVRPQFSNVNHHTSPKVQSFELNPIALSKNNELIKQFDFAINSQHATFVGMNEQGEWKGVSYTKAQDFGFNDGSDWSRSVLDISSVSGTNKVQDFALTPDGQTLYVLYSQSISVFKLHDNQFVLRENVPIGDSDKASNAVSIDLLSGAYSVLLTQEDGRVSQWFDVLKDGKRQFTFIRDFKPYKASKVNFLLTDFYRKGFYRFDENGWLDNFYTTAENRVFSQFLNKQKLNERRGSKSNSAGSTALITAASSASEDVLLLQYPDHLSLYDVNNPYPDISFSALWKKVWYEGYPEPEYVWQSSAATNDFEAKFSLMPIAFGTLKSALFAMIFAVPIAIFGAIYTGYFMTPTMRRYVKPTIELMEALPTVIIGFLAGLWLAPIVELNLLNSLLFVLSLPIVILLAAVIWHWVQKHTSLGSYQGWVALMLVPVIVAFGWLLSLYGHQIEAAMFGGDVRLYLAKLGIDYDQRNALIVGFAMGFAVIPTIFTIAEDAIFSVPKHLSDGASALGATPWQCLTTVVLVTASPGIFSAVMMGLGRAVGETMIVLMATGNTPIMDWNIFEGMRTLSANIAIEMPESDVGSSHFRLLFLSAFLLFVFTFVVNSIAEFIRQRLREKYSAL
ncbi:MAG: phosphate ABC transporter permease [Vibrio sp.]